MIKLSKIFHEIMSVAEHHECSVELHQEASPMVPFTSYKWRPEGGVVRLVLAQFDNNQAFFERLFLHEVCHHISWMPEWSQVTLSNWKSYPSTQFCEYEAESLCRAIAKRHKWQHIIDESNNMLLKNTKRGDTIPEQFREANRIAGDIWGWEYAAQRIIEEDGLLADTVVG